MKMVKSCHFPQRRNWPKGYFSSPGVSTLFWLTCERRNNFSFHSQSMKRPKRRAPLIPIKSCLPLELFMRPGAQLSVPFPLLNFAEDVNLDVMNYWTVIAFTRCSTCSILCNLISVLMLLTSIRVLSTSQFAAWFFKDTRPETEIYQSTFENATVALHTF